MVLETCRGMKLTYCKTKLCASSWLITKINILRCTVNKTSTKKSLPRGSPGIWTGTLYAFLTALRTTYPRGGETIYYFRFDYILQWKRYEPKLNPSEKFSKEKAAYDVCKILPWRKPADVHKILYCYRSLQKFNNKIHLRCLYTQNTYFQDYTIRNYMVYEILQYKMRTKPTNTPI